MQAERKPSLRPSIPDADNAAVGTQRQRSFRRYPYGYLLLYFSLKELDFMEKTQAVSNTAAQKSILNIKKLVLTAMLSGLAFVLSTFVYFPNMAPFQHFVNVMAAVFVGPWYGSAAGVLTGLMRMACGRTIGSVIGAMIGPILGGLLYRRFGTLWSVYIGEVIGTGVLSAIAVYPFYKYIYGLDLTSPLYYIPFYTPSAAVGAAMGVMVLIILKKTGLLSRLLSELNN